MTLGNEYLNRQAQYRAYPYSPVYNVFPYSHYYHLSRSESSTVDLPPDNQNAKKQIVDGHINASVGSGQGINLSAGGEVGGKHGIGLNVGGHLAYNGGDAYANGHLGTKYGILNAQSKTHLDSSQGLGFNTETEVGGKYGLAAHAKTQLGGGQGAGFNTEAQLGGEYGLNANAEGHLGLSQGAGFNTGLQVGGENGIGAKAQAQLGGGQGAGLGITGQVGKYNGQLGFNLGGKDEDTKD